jgi:cell division septation protein DedD
LLLICTAGTYYFYGSVDDLLQLYGARVARDDETDTEVPGAEELLLTATYSQNHNGQYHPTCSGCKVPKSRGISLVRGERYRLRARYVNTNTYDQIEIAMKIELPGHEEQRALPRPTAQPVSWNATLSPSARPSAAPGPSRAPTHSPTTATASPSRPTARPTASPSRRPSASPTARPTAFPTAMPSHSAAEANGTHLPAEIRRQERHLTNTFLRHHSLKDIQIVSLQIPFQYEIKVRPVRINGKPPPVQIN